MQYLINKNRLEVVKGNITEETTEAIVNAANNHLWMGAGVAGAIKRTGGEEIEKEAVAQGPVEVGQAILTSGGKLKAKYVIHAAVMGQDLHTDALKITMAIKNTFRLAEQKQITSVSIPALGTGVGGFSVFYCAKILMTESIECLLKSAYIHIIRFVLFDEQSLVAFEEELKLQFSSKRH
jgi:O-acetyl-ADP-ribose deacetylase (regulator of RNase III)